MPGAELILSKSSIETFLACNYAWYLGYALRIPSAPNLDMAVGTAVHKGVEQYWTHSENGPRHPFSAARAAQEALARELATMPPVTPAEAKQVETDALAMLRTYLVYIVPTFSPDIIERDFLIRVNGVLVSGRIDAADGDVHDTKTTSTPSKVDPDKHRLGMSLYRWGYRALTGHFPGRLLLDIVARNGKWKIVEVTPDDGEMADVVAHVASRINAGSFEPTGAATGQCPRCPFLNLCPYGAPFRLDTAGKMQPVTTGEPA